jgi:hypothetical protein
MALNGALAHLQEADEVGSKTMGKMQAQTAKLDKMNKDMDLVNANLDTTEAIVGDMEKGYGQYLAESALGVFGIDCSTKVETKVDTTVPTLKEGWLHKRGPMYGYAWEPRYCALYDTGLVWFADEQKLEKKGDMDVKKNTKPLSFQKNKAPGDAIKHRGEKPFGFVVDVTPNAGPGKQRRLFYFDGENKPNADGWIEAIEGVARKMKKKDKSENLGGAGAAPIDQINDVLDSLHDQALDMGVEAKKQAKLVQQVTTKVDSTTERLDSQTERLKAM